VNPIENVKGKIKQNLNIMDLNIGTRGHMNKDIYSLVSFEDDRIFIYEGTSLNGVGDNVQVSALSQEYVEKYLQLKKMVDKFPEENYCYFRYFVNDYQEHNIFYDKTFQHMKELKYIIEAREIHKVKNLQLALEITKISGQ
jgi:hypothetical protein